MSFGKRYCCHFSSLLLRSFSGSVARHRFVRKILTKVAWLQTLRPAQHAHFRRCVCSAKVPAPSLTKECVTALNTTLNANPPKLVYVVAASTTSSNFWRVCSAAGAAVLARYTKSWKVFLEMVTKDGNLLLVCYIIATFSNWQRVYVEILFEGTTCFNQVIPKLRWSWRDSFGCRICPFQMAYFLAHIRLISLSSQFMSLSVCIGYFWRF